MVLETTLIHLFHDSPKEGLAETAYRFGPLAHGGLSEFVKTLAQIQIQCRRQYEVSSFSALLSCRFQAV